MKEREEHQLLQDKDRHLDIPAEANRDEHINFLDIEAGDDESKSNQRKDKQTEERQKQWREGIEEGKRAKDKK